MKVAYATGSRADYGIVRRFLNMLNKDKEIDFSVLVTGSHLEDKFGKSVGNIEADGFKVGFKAPMNINNSSNAGIIHSMAVALDLFGRHFEENKYNLIIILGDRYEMLAVAISAAMQRIPILHLHGGEATYANYDEFIRHSITKMSTYHFTSTEVYRKRIIQLGEEPERVFNLGALGAENCQMIDVDIVDERVKALPNKNYFVIAFHPETLTVTPLADQVKEVLKAVDAFQNRDFIFMGTNADTGSDAIREAWLTYEKDHANVHYFENIGNDSYLYMVKHSIALVGNSSSGIIEAPSLGVCTVNIGYRQDGRVQGNSVFNVRCVANDIIDAMHRAEMFNISDIQNPYYVPDTSKRYYEKTKQLLECSVNTIKPFYDICFTE